MPTRYKAPPWYRPGHRPVIFTLTQAEGIGFAPSNLARPMVYGSLRDGISHVRAREAMGYVSDRHAWVRPFLHKLMANEPFTLEEILEAARAAGCRPREWEDGMLSGSSF